VNSSQRIVFNTGVSYARSVLSIGLGLFSSRWVLNALGQTDFGLFSIVGSIIIFITFLSGVMAGSASRHYAYYIGRGDFAEVNRWFNSVFCIHFILATVLVLIGWPVGDYIISHVLTIPTDRIPGCLWVFRVSLISAFVSMFSIPFVAMFVAEQRIAEVAVWGMFYSILLFMLAWNLTSIHGDRLLLYTAGMVAIIVFVQIGQVVQAMFVFDECKIKYRDWFNGQRFRKLLSFASWNLIGSFGVILRNQGSAILLNLHFGPLVNAAYGIANQVSMQTDQLAAAMFGAFSPEIIASEGRGDRARMLSLAEQSSKYGTLLVMLFAIPLIVEMDYVLKLWLVNPPQYTELFCQLMLATFIIDRLSAGYMLAVNAHGRIASYQATLGTCLILTLPMAWLFIKLGAQPTSVGAAFIITMVSVSVGRVLWVRRLLGVPIRRWIFGVVLPCVAVAIATTLVVMVPVILLQPSLSRTGLTTMTGVMTNVLTTWLFVFNERERGFFVKNMERLVEKLQARLTR
jgi:O-antigen/teichoic acid export membrane protein